METDEWIIALGRKCQYLKSLNIRAVVLHFDRDQTRAAVPFRSVDEGERERKGMKRKQEQIKFCRLKFACYETLTHEKSSVIKL